MKVKSKLDTVNKILAVILVIALVALILVVSLYKGNSAQSETDPNASSSSEDVATIDAFVAGTYGGKTFNSIDDIVNYYVECYNYTKTLTASYTTPSGTETLYKLIGDEDLKVDNILVEGKSNSIIDGIVPGIVSGLFSGGVKGLPPSGSLIAANDKVGDSAIDASQSHLTADDVLAANVVDNGDGTINITIQPKGVILSMPGEDAQGKFFNVLGDITSTVNSISMLSFSSGTIDENFVVNYKGGSGVITINTSTNEIVKADYTLLVHIDVQHANISVVKDKSASLDITYTNSYPASDDYLSKQGYARL
ncbi:MAG: hypothetical protein LUG21_03885 [Clostridiales bacterium]|nr:hypothetical protein [Clostridiales bacterium]